jgi:hypothetical protein
MPYNHHHYSTHHKYNYPSSNHYGTNYGANYGTNYGTNHGTNYKTNYGKEIDNPVNHIGIHPSKNKVFAFVLMAMYFVALLMNVINISKHDFSDDQDNKKRTKLIFNLVSIFGFGFSLCFITFSAVNKDWFHLSFFITLMYFVFAILVKKEDNGDLYPTRTIFTLSH